MMCVTHSKAINNYKVFKKHTTIEEAVATMTVSTTMRAKRSTLMTVKLSMRETSLSKSYPIYKIISIMRATKPRRMTSNKSTSRRVWRKKLRRRSKKRSSKSMRKTKILRLII